LLTRYLKVNLQLKFVEYFTAGGTHVKVIIAFIAVFGIFSPMMLSFELPEQSVLLSYFFNENNLLISLFTKEGFQGLWRISIDCEEFLSLIRQFKIKVSCPPDPQRESTAILETKALGAELYNFLLAPVEEYLAEVKHLVIVPTGPLTTLPFAALFRPDEKDPDGGDYLIERFSFSYLPSILCCPKPYFSLYEKALIVDFATLSPLEMHFMEEAQKFFPKATKVNDLLSLKKWLRTEDIVDVLHILGGKVLISSQELWAPVYSSAQGTFGLADLLGSQAYIDLLLFSDSFESTSEEALLYAIEVLLAARINTIIFSLDSCSNSSARDDLFLYFYQRLTNGYTKAEALQAAQLEVLKNHPQPFFWANFFLYGDWQGKMLSYLSKLEYNLYEQFMNWQRKPSAPLPILEVLLTFSHPISEQDLDSLQAVSPFIYVLGSFGAFVIARIPVPLLKDVAQLPEVRFISEVPEIIP